MTASLRRTVRNTIAVCLITSGMSAVAWQEHTWRNGVDRTQEQFQAHKEKQAATEAKLATSVDQLTQQVVVLARLLQDQQKTQSTLILDVYKALADLRRAARRRVDTPRDTE